MEKILKNSQKKIKK